MKQTVIILGSNPASRLALIRAVGEVEGCRVTIVNMVSQLPDKPFRTIDSYSKYVDGVLFARKFDADGLANLLLSKCQDEIAKPIVMSIDDDSACLVDSIQDRLRNRFFVPHIQHRAGAIAHLKLRHNLSHIPSNDFILGIRRRNQFVDIAGDIAKVRFTN